MLKQQTFIFKIQYFFFAVFLNRAIAQQLKIFSQENEKLRTLYIVTFEYIAV